eukprot:2431390-Pleurochrysis_carterae.AAC.1
MYFVSILEAEAPLFCAMATGHGCIRQSTRSDRFSTHLHRCPTTSHHPTLVFECIDSLAGRAISIRARPACAAEMAWHLSLHYTLLFKHKDSRLNVVSMRAKALHLRFKTMQSASNSFITQPLHFTVHACSRLVCLSYASSMAYRKQRPNPRKNKVARSIGAAKQQSRDRQAMSL